MKNKTKEKLREGKAVLGAVATVDHPAVARVLGQTGFDFLLIETQHSTVGEDALNRMITTLLPTDSEIIVRVLSNNDGLIGQALDAGADGVIVPLVNTREEAERAVAATKYPPEGVRSWGPGKTDKYGGSGEYAVRANDEMMTLIQIESVQAVENIDEILSVKGVDGIMIGPGDLSLSMGHRPGLPPAPEVDEMIARILGKCKEHGVPFGMFTAMLEIAETWLGQGGQIGTVGSDVGYVREGAEKTLQGMQKLLSTVNA